MDGGLLKINLRVVHIGRVEDKCVSSGSVLNRVVSQPSDDFLVKSLDLPICLRIVVSGRYIFYAKMCAYSCGKLNGNGDRLSVRTSVGVPKFPTQCFKKIVATIVAVGVVVGIVLGNVETR